MLKLYFHFNGHLLKVRQQREDEVFEHSYVWKNRIEFAFIEDTVLMMAWTSLLPDLRREEAESLVDLVSARYPLSHDFDEMKRLCPDLVVGENAPEWVFYGGTFNPWHEGHQACLNLIPQDKYCFVLPDFSPHKEMRNIEAVPTIIDLAHKMKFVTNQFLVPTFLMEKKKNPTVTWIKRLSEKFPNKKLSLLLGFDSLKNIHSWTDSSELLGSLHRLYVVSRLENNEEQIRVKAAIKGPEVIYLGRHEYERLSSTELRDK